MKKSTLLICALLLTGFGVFAQQSLNTSNYTLVVTDPSNTTVLASHVTLTNTGANDISVMVERTINNLPANMYELFCFGAWCYPPGTGVSTNATVIPAGSSNSSFVADVDPNSECGDASIHYRFYDENNISDSIGITLEFKSCVVGLADNKENFGFSKPLRNPADSYTLLTYNLATNNSSDKVVIYNMLGSLVQSVEVPGKNGTIVLNTSDLKAGVYFISYLSNNKVQNTNKLVVSH